MGGYELQPSYTARQAAVEIQWKGDQWKSRAELEAHQWPTTAVEFHWVMTHWAYYGADRLSGAGSAGSLSACRTLGDHRKYASRGIMHASFRFVE